MATVRRYIFVSHHAKQSQMWDIQPYYTVNDDSPLRILDRDGQPWNVWYSRFTDSESVSAFDMARAVLGVRLSAVDYMDYRMSSDGIVYWDDDRNVCLQVTHL
jgi:hypothetical protein